jgi:hypothetical protein
VSCFQKTPLYFDVPPWNVRLTRILQDGSDQRSITPKAFADIEAGGDAASLGHAEWLALLLEREASLRRDKRLSKRLRYAKLRQQACVEDIAPRAVSTAAS